MKIVEEINDIQRQGVVEKIACTMSVNAHAFKLLSRQYADPVKAILQELGSNAVDSHVRANNTQPFVVQLPGRMDNHLRIRDFGTGMSEDKIRNVYANWMNSDKRESNDEVGYFGIGSKTPLSYTDSFNITSYVDGKMYMYTLCRNEQDIPELQFYGSSETAEPNGVEISFAVNPDDFTIFNEKAKQVYQYFNLRPIINGVQIAEPEKKYEGDSWAIYSGKAYESHALPKVVMGGVAYPISIAFRYPNENVRKFFMTGMNLVFRVDIGELDVTPSRESLEFTPRTLKALCEVGDKVRQEFTAIAQKTVAVDVVKDMSSWAYHLYYEDQNKFFNKYNVQIKPERPLPNYPIYSGDNNKFLVLGWFEKKQSRVLRKRSSINDSKFVTPSKTTLIVRQDELSKYEENRRVRHFMLTNNIETCIIVAGVANNTITTISRQEVMDVLGFNDGDNVLVDVSALPDPPKANRRPAMYTPRKARKPKHMERVLVLDVNTTGSPIWEEQLVDLSVDQYYGVQLGRGDKLDEKQNLTVAGLLPIVSKFNIKLIGMKNSNQEKLVKLGVKPLFGVGLQELLSQTSEGKDMVESIKTRQVRDKWQSIFTPIACEMRFLWLGSGRMEKDLGDHELVRLVKLYQKNESKSFTTFEYLCLNSCPDLFGNLDDAMFEGKTLKQWETHMVELQERYSGVNFDENENYTRVVKAVDAYFANL